MVRRALCRRFTARSNVAALLSAVAAGTPQADLIGDDIEVVDATHDSRQASAGSLFCAVPGAHVDGHAHVAHALANGAVAAVVERDGELDCPRLRVPSVRAAMGPAAAVVHGRPSEELVVVGVTGTNGKTTTTTMLEAAFGAAGWGTGVIGTVSPRIHGESTPGVRTTPEGTDLQRLLRTMVVRGVDAVAMEVSSHGLDLSRVDGTRFTVAVFTNLSRDHLDWHGTMERYFAAKARLFTPALSDRGVIDVDSTWGRRLADASGIPVRTVGVSATADVRILAEHTALDGGRARVLLDGDELEVATPLAGAFNLRNAVLAVIAAIDAGVPVADAVAGVSAAPPPRGRLEPVDAGQSFRVFVDYAHTPEALAGLIDALRRSSPPETRLILVFGAGGDRDPGKRAPMGAAAAAADVAVITSDNPRSEDPSVIARTIERGLRAAIGGHAPEVVVELDRRRAIVAGIERATDGDVVVIAGKGHETVQEIGGQAVAFDDVVVAREVLCGMRRGAAAERDA